MATNDWLGCDAGPLYDPFREASLSEQQRRERKLAAAKGWLGERYLLHPANRVQKKEQWPRHGWAWLGRAWHG